MNPEAPPTAEALNALLPQTQCRQCGYSGCLPYAEALAAGAAAPNLCTPGGAVVLATLCSALNEDPSSFRLPEHAGQQALAFIDEAACIGCVACIRACPVDAIVGTAKQMHSILSDECTGCGLCLPPCPVDCISMVPVADAFLPRHRFLGETEAPPRLQAAQHARRRYEAHQARREAKARQRLAGRTAASTPAVAASAPSTVVLDAQALIAAARQQAAQKRVSAAQEAAQAAYSAEAIRRQQQQSQRRFNIRARQYGLATAPSEDAASSVSSCVRDPDT